MTQYQKFVVAVLAFLQFTVVLDFMIMSPMGAILMPALNMSPAQFGLVVSIYALSAGTSGLLAAGFADRYDRKKLLMFFYVGFVVGTFLCGMANGFEFLLVARMITGLFGGVLGSIVLAIVADLFPFEMRGRVMGFIQTAFAGSQVLGIPAGLYFSTKWGWHAPFMMIVIISTIVGVFIYRYLQPINAHLQHRVDKHPFHHFKHTISNSKYLLAFGATALLSLGGFMLMPFGSDYTVHNLGIDLAHLPMMYLITGLTTMFVGPMVGRLSDAIGKFRTFVFGCALTITMVLIYTHLGVTPLYLVVIVNSLLFVGIFSRIIPTQALASAVPTPSDRGSFMSVSSSLQQIAGGIASAFAGMIVSRAADGKIQHFDILGFILVGTTLITIIFMYKINKMVPQHQKATQKTPAEMH